MALRLVHDARLAVGLPFVTVMVVFLQLGVSNYDTS